MKFKFFHGVVINDLFSMLSNEMERVATQERRRRRIEVERFIERHMEIERMRELERHMELERMRELERSELPTLSPIRRFC